ncbi:hypothetical protein ACH5RR_008646 [Cinchona calisaya]|uniref:Uncharacterized protein n=1 Tax=Cinchona calisaya TaxID=153742 RepID=A0ABD3ADP6_9GENT
MARRQGEALRRENEALSRDYEAFARNQGKEQVFGKNWVKARKWRNCQALDNAMPSHDPKMNNLYRIDIAF